MLFAALVGCSVQRSLPPATTQGSNGAARNIILFIGDGMGVSTVTAARIFDGQTQGMSGEEHLLVFETFPHVAMVKTYNTNQQVPDSAGATTRETDIEHIVARSEAHDSGMCAASTDTKRAFARDLINLTLASPSVNRSQKSANDVAEWQPSLNACWFVARTLEVRRKYDLTIDRREADAAEWTLAMCASRRLHAASGQRAASRPTAVLLQVGCEP